MFTFFKRSSAKHKCEDSRSASGTPPPCSSRLLPATTSSLLTTEAGGSGGERKAPKNKRVRFKFVSDHDEDEARQKRFEEPVSASHSSQLHGKCVDSANQRDPHPFYSVEEPLSPTRVEDQHVFGYDGQEEYRLCRSVTPVVVDEGQSTRVKPRSALNQLLDRMGGKKNRYRGNNVHGGNNSKKAKHQQQNNNSAIVDHKPQNVDYETVKKCDQDDEYDFYYDRDGCVRGADTTTALASEEDETTLLVEGDEEEEDRAAASGGVGEITEVAVGKAAHDIAAFNARADQHENRSSDILQHKINLERSGDEHSTRLSHNNNGGSAHDSIEKPQFRLFVNEQPTIAEEDESPGNTATEEEHPNPAADFVRDLVLNRYKKKRDRPVTGNRRVDDNEIPTVIFEDTKTVPVVVEKSDDEEEDHLTRIMGQPNSKANSPNPLEKSSSDGSIHPTVIITEEEVFYEASAEPEIVHGVVVEGLQDADNGSILRELSPLTIGGAFKTIHVSTEDLQDELEKEESETDSGNYNSNSCYQNTIKNKCGVTVTEIVDSSGSGASSSNEDEDSGCEEILGSVSPQQRPSPVPVVVVDNRSAAEEEESDGDDSDRQMMMARKNKQQRLGMEAENVSLPDVVESIGLPNVVHVLQSSANSGAKFSASEKKNNNMTGSQNGAAQGVLHVDGNSHKSSLVRNIPITILEEASEEEEDEQEDSEVEGFKGKKKGQVNGQLHQNNVRNNNKDYTKQQSNGFSITDKDKSDLQSNGFDCDKRDLVNQDALQSKGRVAELQAKLDELERMLSVKEWTIDRLEAELASATKEGEGVRRKLKSQEEEMLRCRHKYEDSEDELNRRFMELEERYSETTGKLASITAFTSHLQVQLAEAQSDAESSRAEKEQLINARTEEEKIIRDSLEQAIEERNQVDAKWQKEFEQLRSLHQDREEHLMEDVEWKMRSMQRQCKEKLDKAEELQRELVEITKMQEDKIESLSTLEAEVKGLRGLTGEQCENLSSIMRQLEEAKEELNEANERCEEEIRSAQKIKVQCENEVLCKERYAQIKIEEAKMQISVQWERKLMEEMLRLKCELEAVHAEDRKDALEELKEETKGQINELVKAHKALEKSLNEEINRLKEILEVKKGELLEAQKYADKQVVDTRNYVDRSDRQNQLMLDREIRNREELIEQMEKDRERDREEMEEQFRERLQSVKDEFARELVESALEVEAKYKRIIETQIEQFVAEKEEAETQHKHKIKTMEERMRDLEIQFQREKQDYERNHNIERTSMAKREMQNSQEIDQLHRKCRCLTKLFEEMRMRYERREPRQEDQREIAELKERCESQERDLARLTETLRQLQIIQEHHPVPPGQDASMPVDPPRQKGRILASPGHNCDVIYEEENEEEDEQSTSIDDEEESSTATALEVMSST